MIVKPHLPTALILAAGLAASPALAQEDQPNVSETASTGVSASADFINAEGAEAGTARLIQTPVGVLIQAELTGLPPGEHGFHVHQTGECEPPFESAGDHFNPRDAQHGYFVAEGPHAGDMPNIHVPESGEVNVEAMNPFISLVEGEEMLFDDDGAALMVHSGADDYQSQPSGDAGDRIACAIIEPQQ
jgi:superoxide dismutase, Cu-Zn family